MVVCSVIARNYVAHARVLARSLRAHHEDARLHVLVVDDAQDSGGDEPFVRVPSRATGVSDRELERRATMYDRQALVSSLKARLVSALLARTGEPVLLLDADMMALARLDDVIALAARHGIVLSPHTTVPLSFRPGRVNAEQVILRAGVMNGGFLAVSPAAEPFLAWWDERCARDCIWDPERATSLSQTWLSLVPALYDHHVLRDRGVNLMGHGLAADDVRWDGDAPFIGSVPVRLFHFAGRFDPRTRALGGPRAPAWWPRLADRPGLARLCDMYARQLLEAGYAGLADDSGDPLDWAMRRAYREALIEAEAEGGPEPPNPLSDGRESFVAWLGAPRWPSSAVSRYLAALWSARADLRAAFPAVPGPDEAGLIAWAASKQPAGEPPGALPTAALTS